MSLSAFTLPRQYVLVRDMQADWQVYDAQYNVYVPYLAERHSKPKSVSFWLDLEENQHYTLMLKANAPLFFFINGKLCKEYNNIKNETWLSLNLDSLKKNFPTEKKVFCTLYDTKRNLPLSSLCIATKNFAQETSIIKTPVKADTLTRTSRLPTGKDWVILVSVFLLLLFTLLWNIYPRGLLSYLSFQSSISPIARKDMNLLQKPLGVPNLLLVLGNSFQVSVSFWVYQQMSMQNQYLNNLSVLGNYFYIAFGVFGLFLIKYSVLRISGVLLNTSQSVVNMHFFETVRLSYLFYGVLLFLPLYCWISAPQFMSIYVDIFKYLVVIFHIIQSFLIGFWVFKQIEYKNLYFFYYLCTTEIVPLFFGIKWLIIS